MKDIFRLFITFFKIGLFTFGGGYAMLPMFQKELVEKYGWITDEELLDYFSISQVTPGVIAVNTSTFVGSKVKGFAGALAALAGVILPSLVIITLIASVLSKYAASPAVTHAFNGIRAGVSALIFASMIKLWKAAVKSKIQLAVALISFLTVAVFGVSPVIVVAGAALFGFFFYKGKFAKEGDSK